MADQEPVPDVPQDLVLAMKALKRRASRLSIFSNLRKVLADLEPRVEAGKTDLLQRAGLWRSAHSYLEDSLQVREPDWITVKILHRVWVECVQWSRAAEPTRKV